MSFVSAGHPPGFLRRGKSVTRIGECGGIPLGVLRDHRYQNQSCRLAAGDFVIAYSDGLIEALDARGEAFGIDRVAAIITAAPPRAALIAHQENVMGRDDQTILVIGQLPGVPESDDAT